MDLNKQQAKQSMIFCIDSSRTSDNIDPWHLFFTKKKESFYHDSVSFVKIIYSNSYLNMNGIYINLGSSSSSHDRLRVEHDLISTLEALESKVREEYEAVFVLAKGKVWKSSWRHYLLDLRDDSSQEQRVLTLPAAVSAATSADTSAATSAILPPPRCCAREDDDDDDDEESGSALWRAATATPTCWDGGAARYGGEESLRRVLKFIGVWENDFSFGLSYKCFLCNEVV